MKYQLVVFDMDGTILDTLGDLTDSINAVLSENGLPGRTEREVRSYLGNGLRRLVELSLPDATPAEMTDRVFLRMKDYYASHCAIRTCPYDGILPLIRRLKENGIKVAVVSNKIDEAVQELCAGYFDNVFDYAIGERPGMRKKPAPDPVNAVLDALGFDRGQAVYVGDTEVDIQTAKNAGMDCIAVDWGFRDRAYLSTLGAEYMVSDPADIAGIVLGK